MPTNTRLVPGDQAPNLTLTNIEGETVSLSDYWSRGPIVLTFLRHFGCLFCRARLDQLGRAQAALDSAGLTSVAIGIGEPKHARRYGEQLAPHTHCLVTNGTEAHRAYGVARGNLLQLSGLRTVGAALRAAGGGHTQGAATGDMQMLSATLLIDTRGTVRFSHYAGFAGDDPSLETILAAARTLEAPAQPAL